MNNKIEVAKIGKTVGLKGEVKLHLLTDFPNQFKKGIKFSTDISEVEIEYYHKDRGVVKFKNYSSVEDIQKLINKTLYCNFEETRKNCKLNKDEFFWFDVIHCKVVENGKVLGIIKDIERFGVADYFIILTDEDLLKQKLPNRFLLPYIDKYILNVDIKNKIVTTKGAMEILENS